MVGRWQGGTILSGMSSKKWRRTTRNCFGGAQKTDIFSTPDFSVFRPYDFLEELRISSPICIFTP